MACIAAANVLMKRGNAKLSAMVRFPVGSHCVQAQSTSDTSQPECQFLFCVLTSKTYPAHRCM